MVEARAGRLPQRRLVDAIPREPGERVTAWRRRLVDALELGYRAGMLDEYYAEAIWQVIDHVRRLEEALSKVGLGMEGVE